MTERSPDRHRHGVDYSIAPVRRNVDRIRTDIRIEFSEQGMNWIVHYFDRRLNRDSGSRAFASPALGKRHSPVGFLRIRSQATQYRPCHCYNLSCVPGLASSSEDFLYASDNVGDPFFLFEEALPIIGPQRIGGAVGGHGVFFM